MKQLYKETLPKCYFCVTDAMCDAPTKDGRWANMCAKHLKMHGGTNKHLGYQFVKRVKQPVRDVEPIAGIMKSSIEDMINDSMMVVECPVCHETKSLEQDVFEDSIFIYNCGCGTPVRVDDPMY